MDKDLVQASDDGDEADLPIEQFVLRGNARDRGEEVPDLPSVGAEASVAAPPAAVAGNGTDAAHTEKPIDKRTREGRKQTIQQDIDANIERRRVAKEEADAEETRLTSLREESKRLTASRTEQSAPVPRTGQPAQPAAETDLEPKFEDYQTGGRLHNPADQDPYTTFIRASAGWEGRRAYQREASRVQAETFYKTRTMRVTERLAAYEKDHPGFGKRVHATVSNPLLNFSIPTEYGTPLGDLVIDSPHVGPLLDHFTGKPDDLQRLSTLHPVLMARELGKLEERFDAALQSVPAQTVKVSTAKPPIKTVGSSPVVSDDAEDEGELPIEDFIRVGNARDARQSSARH